MFRPETGKPLYELVEALIRNPSGSLTAAEKELIAAYTSSKNDCVFCMSSHAAAARYLYKDEKQVVDFVLEDFENAPIPDKLKALLRIAGKVQEDARTVTTELVELAKQLGASDRDIHDTVLIAAAFCMFNRYVDGLASLTPTDPKEYEAMGVRMGEIGYVPPKK
jgi:uncharacterized peroxidase-related enzyme